jgi:hypothetical protein
MSHENQTLSRRAILAGAASVPAFAVPALAANDNPDAELIAQGEAYARLLPVFEALQDDHSKKTRLAQNLAWERVGYETTPRHPTKEQCYLFMNEWKKTDVETGNDVAGQKVETVSREIYPIEDQIMETPARTVAGLRVKAMLTVSVATRLWEKPFRDLDYDQQAMRSLIEAVCAVAGLDLPPENLAVQS